MRETRLFRRANCHPFGQLASPRRDANRASCLQLRRYVAALAALARRRLSPSTEKQNQPKKKLTDGEIGRRDSFSVNECGES